MNKKGYVVLVFLSFSLLFSFWWIITSLALIKEFFLPHPVQVAHAILQLFIKQNFLKDIAASLFRILAGFAIGILFAVPLGTLLALNKRVEALIEPVFIDFFRYIPIPAFIPLFILWFGIGELEKVIVIASSVFLQLVLMVANSVSSTPKEFIESAKTLGAKQWQIITKVIYPFSQPRIFDDARISIGWAWSGLILAEMVGSTSGIGSAIIQSQRLLRTANVIGIMIIVGLLGLLSDFIFRWSYKILFPWASRLNYHAKTQ